MSNAEIWAVIAGGMLVTYASRLSFIALVPADRLPPRLRLALRFVPPAVLAALVGPELLLPQGQLDISLGNERLIAGMAASLAAWCFRNTWATLAVGLFIYAILLGR